jgi:hypothetical protein
LDREQSKVGVSTGGAGERIAHALYRGKKRTSGQISGSPHKSMIVNGNEPSIFESVRPHERHELLRSVVLFPRASPKIVCKWFRFVPVPIH